MFTDTQLFDSLELSLLDFCLLVLLKSEVCKRNLDARDKFFARILCSSGRKKKREDQLRRTTRDLHTRVAKYTEVDGGIFKLLFRTIPIFFSFSCNKYVI
jgi:hypothetical protein